MISKQDLERVLSQQTDGKEVISLFLDMSVNSDNKRTHQIFLNQRRAQLSELVSERNGNGNAGVEEVGAAFDRIEQWLAEQYSEENRGVVIYTEVGGDWFEALQFPVAISNRIVFSSRPAIGPLAEVIESYSHHGVVLLDREHVRILSVYLGTLLDEIEVHGEPYPAPHDLQAGGYSQTRFQRRKLEEMKHFFKDFSREVEDFTKRYRPDDLLILGTDENVAKFREFLPAQINEMVVYTGPMGVDEPAAEILERLEPHLQAERQKEGQQLLQELRGRIKQDYLATAGFQSTLSALQEGRVDSVVIAKELERRGIRCTKCGFVFARGIERCPYDGAPVESDIDIVEEVIRLAEEHKLEIEFVPTEDMSDLAGVGALLRF